MSPNINHTVKLLLLLVQACKQNQEEHLIFSVSHCYPYQVDYLVTDMLAFKNVKYGKY